MKRVNFEMGILNYNYNRRKEGKHVNLMYVVHFYSKANFCGMKLQTLTHFLQSYKKLFFSPRKSFTFCYNGPFILRI